MMCAMSQLPMSRGEKAALKSNEKKSHRRNEPTQWLDESKIDGRNRVFSLFLEIEEAIAAIRCHQ